MHNILLVLSNGGWLLIALWGLPLLRLLLVHELCLGVLVLLIVVNLAGSRVQQRFIKLIALLHALSDTLADCAAHAAADDYADAAEDGKADYESNCGHVALRLRATPHVDRATVLAFARVT